MPSRSRSSPTREMLCSRLDPVARKFTSSSASSMARLRGVSGSLGRGDGGRTGVNELFDAFADLARHRHRMSTAQTRPEPRHRERARAARCSVPTYAWFRLRATSLGDGRELGGRIPEKRVDSLTKSPGMTARAAVGDAEHCLSRMSESTRDAVADSTNPREGDHDAEQERGTNSRCPCC